MNTGKILQLAGCILLLPSLILLGLCFLVGFGTAFWHIDYLDALEDYEPGPLSIVLFIVSGLLFNLAPIGIVLFAIGTAIRMTSPKKPEPAIPD